MKTSMAITPAALTGVPFLFAGRAEEGIRYAAEVGYNAVELHLRETRLEHWDRVVAEAPVRDGRTLFALPPRSMVQVVFSDIDPADVRRAEIVEESRTPGRCASLGLLQTTRLRLVAKVKGRRTDLTDHNVVWESEDGQFVRVGQGGLVQRVRSTARTIKVSARLVDGTRLAEIAVPPDRQR